MSKVRECAEELGVEKFKRHIFLCADQTEPKCCKKEDGLRSWEYLKGRLKELKLAGPEPLVYRTKANDQHLATANACHGCRQSVSQLTR